MPRLINADVVVENIDEWLDCVGCAVIGKGLSYYYELLGCIEEAPTVDAVEVVRCKDCKHYNKHLALEPFCEYLTDKLGYCDDVVYMQDDDFCSYGRRDGD